MQLIFQPIFICGAGRSGSTLLRNIFDLHPSISVAPELRFFDMALASFTRYNNLAGLKDRDLFVDNVLGKFRKSKDPLWRKIQYDEERLKNKLTGLNNLKSIYFEAIKVCSTKKDKKIFVDKIGTFFIENIIKIFPETVFIHILRDGREFCASAAKRGDWADSLINIAEYWKESLAQYEYYKNKYDNGRNFYEVKYEDLVENAQTTIEKIFEFLNIELPLNFFEKLNTLKASSSFKQNKDKTGIYLSRHFDKYFSQKEKNMINALLGEDLKNLGYQPLPGKINLISRLKAKIEKIKIKLHFWAKKKGVFWRYNKLRKLFR